MNESNIFGLSIRGVIAFIVVMSLCGVCIYLHTAESLGILKDAALVIITFYFSQKTTQGGTNAPTNPNLNASDSTVIKQS